MVPVNEIVIQPYFFTFIRLIQYMLPNMLVRNFVQTISFLICWLMKKVTGYKEISVQGALVGLSFGDWVLVLFYKKMIVLLATSGVLWSI